MVDHPHLNELEMFHRPHHVIVCKKWKNHVGDKKNYLITYGPKEMHTKYVQRLKLYSSI